MNEEPAKREVKGLSAPVAILIAGVLIAGSYYLVNRSPTTVNKDTTASVAGAIVPKIAVDPVTEADHILGNPQAKIVMVEYSDLECPFCKTFHRSLIKIMDEFGKDGSIAWVYRHFPLDTMHSKARKEAEASECAGELGGNLAFWNFIDNIYEITPSNNELDPLQLSATAVKIGLDRKAFEACLDSGKFASKVEAHYQSGLRAGTTGTPNTFLISKGNDTIPIEGAQPYVSIKNIIMTILSVAKNN